MKFDFNNIDFKNDRSWVVIMILLFAITPIGIIALIGKVLYMVYIQGAQTEEPYEFDKYTRNQTNSETRSVDSFESYERAEYGESLEVQAPIEPREEKDSFLDEVANQGTILTEILSNYAEEKAEAELVETKPAETKPAETKPAETKPIELNPIESLGIESEVEVIEPVIIETTISPESDVDLEVLTQRDKEQLSYHEGQVALKVLTCSMCGTDNKIYKVDVFETPSCEKCGMLLLDR